MTDSVDHAGAAWRASPNFGPRRDGLLPEIILLHYTGMTSGQAAEDWLCSPQSQVSSHYIVHEDGRVVQMVRESDRAWHAGQSSWQGRGDINSRSVGIEIVNEGHEGGLPPYPERQIDAVIALCAGIKARLGIEDRGVLAHSDVSPGRKIDPGERFPWQTLAAAGIGLHVQPAPLRPGAVLAEGSSGTAVAELQVRLSSIGYDVPTDGEFDIRTRIVVEAFQRRFRPERVDGMADFSTVETLSRLLQSAGWRAA